MGDSDFFALTFLIGGGFIITEAWVRAQITLPITEEAEEEQPVVHGDTTSCVKHLVEHFRNENENSTFSLMERGTNFRKLSFISRV